MWLICLSLITGFFILYIGAELLVKGASKLAVFLGLSPLLIGLTVVAFGTSAPELLVSVISAIKGKDMIAIGNVVGSNICNIALILGISSLLYPIACQREVIKRDIPVMMGISVFLILISLDSKISRPEGFVLFCALVAYITFNYLQDKKHSVIQEEPLEEDTVKTGLIIKNILLLACGMLSVILGAKLVVNSAEDIMRMFGISEKVIGLSIVAFGTSLPELATSAVAAYKRHTDISIGNLIGSNAFNIMCVLGITALIRPIYIPGGIFQSRLLVDYVIMLLISVMPYLMARHDLVINRKDGFVLLLLYSAYVVYLYVYPTN